MNKTRFTIADDKRTLVIERTFNAPKRKLWEAYTKAEKLALWFAPKGWSTEVKKFDFIEGGEWIYVMKCEDKAQAEWFGKTSAGKAVYRDIIPEDSFGYTDYFTDEEGNANKTMPTSESSVHLTENADKTTRLTVTTTYQTEEGLKRVLAMGMEEGYGQTLDKLEEVVTN